MAVNKFIGIGNLGRDPELRYMGDGKAVCNFSFAITEKYKDKSGDQKEVTEWINVATFGRLAEICGEYVRKGTKVYVEGKLKTEKYTDKNGIEKSATKITAEKVDILSNKGEAVTSAIKEATPTIQEFANDDDIHF